MSRNPLTNLRKSTGSTIILDGGLATALESAGHSLNTPLWSADLLVHNPQAIQDVHEAYFRAGAQVAITASYQGSTRGLSEYLSIDESEAETLVARSVEIAINARDVVASSSHRPDSSAQGDVGRSLLVAGSVGPYGAYLADGSEYTGIYPTSSFKGHSPSNSERDSTESSNVKRDPTSTPRLSETQLSEKAIIKLLKDFHRPRIHALQNAGIDLLACETMPNFLEIKALVELLDELDSKAWFTFTLQDETHISDGTGLKEVVKYIVEHGRRTVIGVGVNCVPLSLVSGAIKVIKRTIEEGRETEGKLEERTDIQIVVYPNSGEQWNGTSKEWEKGELQERGLRLLVQEWVRLGATAIGGCCRMGTGEIQSIEMACRESRETR